MTPVLEAPAREAARQTSLPPWDMYTVFVALMCGYVLLPLLARNILEIAWPFITPVEEFYVSQTVTLLSWIGVFAFLGWKHRVDIRPYLGLSLSRPARYYLFESLLVFLVLVGLILGYSLLGRSAGVTPDQPYAGFAENELVAIAFFAIMMAPVLEELIFRGLLQSTFHKFTTPVKAMLLTCLVFALIHLNYLDKPQALAYVLLIALVLGYWRERTGSILPGMFAHLTNNIMASLLLLRG
jgi:membrane protease YdiL (CAAX protease family)